jgi:hypothetical protein
VECVKVENAESRKNFWLQEGYIDQKPTQSLWFEAHSRYKYRCKLSKTLQNTSPRFSPRIIHDRGYRRNIGSY